MGRIGDWYSDEINQPAKLKAVTKHSALFGRQRDPNLGDDAQSSESVCCRLTNRRLSDKAIAVSSVGARLPSDRPVVMDIPRKTPTQRQQQRKGK
ncbi:hypothetical protein PoB_005451800 [Plakobranchus ocellatus]|uniref:Uncharacterized protein n=1 Tax=Plakobranchus ocellatus TaxID=259542 RepID=A0AAV4C824_9GAST|nr:hypothetical protein PoB_005451800 [Plakobranchus ocellatus]